MCCRPTHWCRCVVTVCVAVVMVSPVPVHAKYRRVEKTYSSFDDLYTFPKLGTFPFMAVVTSKVGVCSGAIVAREWILSAAHCFYFREKVIGPGDARIIAGVVNYEYPNAHAKQDSMSKKIHVHPDFRYNVPSKYDVALVRLRDPFVFTPYVANISVAGDEWPQTDNGSRCMGLGFGSYNSADLKVWNMTAAHGDQACPCAFRFQSKRLVCVAEQAGPLVCDGDDGGPLVCGDEVRGVAHMVWNRVTCDEAVYPTPKCSRGPDRALSTYMFLCPVQDWLHDIVEVIPPEPPSCRASCRTSSLFNLLLVFLCLIFATNSR